MLLSRPQQQRQRRRSLGGNGAWRRRRRRASPLSLSRHYVLSPKQPCQASKQAKHCKVATRGRAPSSRAWGRSRPSSARRERRARRRPRRARSRGCGGLLVCGAFGERVADVFVSRRCCAYILCKQPRRGRERGGLAALLHFINLLLCALPLSSTPVSSSLLQASDRSIALYRHVSTLSSPAAKLRAASIVMEGREEGRCAGRRDPLLLLESRERSSSRAGLVDEGFGQRA